MVTRRLTSLKVSRQIYSEENVHVLGWGSDRLSRGAKGHLEKLCNPYWIYSCCVYRCVVLLQWGSQSSKFCVALEVTPESHSGPLTDVSDVTHHASVSIFTSLPYIFLFTEDCREHEGLLKLFSALKRLCIPAAVWYYLWSKLVHQTHSESKIDLYLLPVIRFQSKYSGL